MLGGGRTLFLPVSYALLPALNHLGRITAFSSEIFLNCFEIHCFDPFYWFSIHFYLPFLKVKCTVLLVAKLATVKDYATGI